MSCRILIVVPILGLFLTGCGETRPSYSMVPVIGSLIVDGKPASGIVVTFDSDIGPRAFGVTDSEGHFTLETKEYGVGAPEGAYKVWVQTTKTASISLPPSLSDSPVDSVDVAFDSANLFEFDLNSRPPSKPDPATESDSAGEA